MRPIVLAQIVSTLLIGVVSAIPTDIDARDVGHSNTDLTEACVHETVYYEDKGCDTEECHHDRKKKKARKCRNRHEDDEDDEDDDDKNDDDKDDDHRKKDKHLRKGKDEDKKKKKIHGGYRCEDKFLSESSVKKSSEEGCEFMKNKMKNTRGYARGYPMIYVPGSGDHVFDSTVIDVNSQYYLYPIRPPGADYKFAGTVPEMVLMDRECTVVAATVEKKTTPCPTKAWCLSSFFKEPNVYYASCVRIH